ncbi:DNA starvation/stationary phase protection protein [Tuanshanicoccus lijuaniae]|uniref:Dps family protein n=1 Tax=Aerococcaceae bacterium zg-1292 TaxID=2774330 RepID=UPI001938DA92|nr:DNA starvation/stationary phase protection protein [Aerococcaceae bacterium zg-1292]MBF6977749.1 DNA starvation/stationary phase protection protein [Aerococcaceae bacterium zg-BR22]QQA36374.1 DNA starvation/stationary phase protection protein [Aerococcaceae bacterium zg-1292]
MKFSQTKDSLNQLVADLSQASTAIHQIHWYLRGANFITWHERMDDYRKRIEAQLDEVAERLITIDGAPFSTLEEFAKETKIDSIDGRYNRDLNEHISRLIVLFRTLIEDYQQVIDVAGEEDDNVSEDMAISFKGELEKLVWMLQAELGHAPEIDA